MSIELLTQATFATTVADCDLLVVEFFGSADALEDVAARVPQARCAQIAPDDESVIAALFGLAEDPALLIFRQQIVLYLESGAHSADRMEALLRQVQALDMDAVRAAIDEEKRAEVALRMRRVCPTARRMPGAGT